jgi:hypothetical protein
VFISYRRQEASHLAGRLYDRLATRFGDDQVFMDVDTIALGVDFAEVITQAVSTCEILLAVIGPGWLTAADKVGRRRLDDPDDLVRLEIAAALERDIRVIPILVEGAVMPRRQELPENLASLARRNALSLRHESFRSDADRLIGAIEPILRIKVDHPPVPPDEVEVGTAILLAAAARRECLSYRQFSEQLRGRGVSVHWRSPRMAKLLLAISEHRAASGQGLLSALVVGRVSGLPGEGFFELAARHGRRGDHRTVWEHERDRVFQEAQESSARTAPLPSVAPPAQLQPRYEQREPYLHRPVGEHMTQHRIGIHNPKENQMVTGVRLQWIEMSPRPRVDLGYPPSIPSAVPMLNGGDATIGISLPPGRQELWMIISTGTGSDGIMSAGVFAPGYRPWYGTPWQFEQDDRWRFTYRIVADNLPNATFSVVMTAVDGHIRCDLEG